MDAQREQGAITYEQGLRVIGRHLDAEPAYHVSILQVEDGYIVRYCGTQNGADQQTKHYSHERLADMLILQTSGRGARNRKHRYQGIWAKFGEPHEEFFRSLGHDLDEEHARSLTVDEVDSEIQVSYLRSDPNDSLRAEKKHLVFKEDDIVAMVERAKARRTAMSPTAAS